MDPLKAIMCKCGNDRCLGYLLLHEKELETLDKIKETIREDSGQNLTFELKRSPSSGEVFTKFYELHTRVIFVGSENK